MNDKKDMTRIEDLSEFLHQDDPDVEDKLNEMNDQGQSTQLQEEEEETPPSFEEFRPEVSESKSINFETTSEVPLPPEEAQNTEVLADAPPAEFIQESEVSTEVAPEITSEENISLENENEKKEKEITLSNSKISEDQTDLSFKNSDNQFGENPFQEDTTNQNPPPIETASAQEPPKAQEDFLTIQEVRTPTTSRETRETYSDVRKFASNIVPGLGMGAGPYYSVLLKNIRYKEDTEDILRILSDFGIINEENKTESENSLKTGNLLLSQLSEYVAIIIAHKIRRFDLDLEIGPSEQIHPSKFYQDEGYGPVTKNNFLVNREDHHDFVKQDLTRGDVLLTTQPILQNYQIIRYVGIVSEHLLVNSDVLYRTEQSSEEGQIDDPIRDFAPLTEDLYNDLQNAIKNKALKMEGNAVIGVNFQITPMRKESDSDELIYYQISCTGNVVLASRISQEQM